jgi:hypothetical protein
VNPDGALSPKTQIVFMGNDGKTYDLTKSISNVTLNYGDPIETTGGEDVERNLLVQLEEYQAEIKRLQKIILNHAKTCAVPMTT